MIFLLLFIIFQLFPFNHTYSDAPTECDWHECAIKVVAYANSLCAKVPIKCVTLIWTLLAAKRALIDLRHSGSDTRIYSSQKSAIVFTLSMRP